MGIRGRHSSADLAGVRTLQPRLPPPDDLTADQRARWLAVTESLPPDAFRPGDLPLLRVFVIAEALYLRAAAELERDGIVIEDAGGRKRAHPASSIMVSQASAMAQVSVKLRLCPQSRYETRTADRMAKLAPTADKPWQLQKSA